MVDSKEWCKIGDKLTNYFGICGCQRKLKSIIDNLYSIYDKCDYDSPNHKFEFTGAEWLLIAILDRSSNAITHGINCEYPILNKEDEFWKWILEVKDNPNLEDN
jgi:hypothetical protein